MKHGKYIIALLMLPFLVFSCFQGWEESEEKKEKEEQIKKETAEKIPCKMTFHAGAGKSGLFLGKIAVYDAKMVFGAGEAEIDFSGNTTLQKLDLRMGIGEISLDLTGNWNHDVIAKIEGGVGTVKVEAEG